MGPKSTSRSISDGVVVGVVRSAHGVRGEVKVQPQTDVAERFLKGSRLFCDGIGELVVASMRGRSDLPIVRFAGYETRADADRLRGRALRVTRDDAREAARGAYLWADLLGLVAETPEGAKLGTVREVLRAGETDVLVVRDELGSGEVLLPAIESVVKEIDLAGGRIVVVPQDLLP